MRHSTFVRSLRILDKCWSNVSNVTIMYTRFFWGWERLYKPRSSFWSFSCNIFTAVWMVNRPMWAYCRLGWFSSLWSCSHPSGSFNVHTAQQQQHCSLKHWLKTVIFALSISQWFSQNVYSMGWVFVSFTALCYLSVL